MMQPLAGLVVVVFWSAVLCIAAGRVVIPALVRAQRLAPVRYEDCPPLQAYQAQKRSTPTMGGLVVLAAGMLVAAFSGGLSSRNGWIVLAATLALGAIGLVDDGLKFRGPNGRGLRSAPKLLATLGIGALLGVASHGAADLHLERLPPALATGWGWVGLAMVVIAGCAHAVNLTDGMDGLAAGCVAAALLPLAVVAGGRGDQPAAAWGASLAGACIGFLWFNGFPASVFLGDVGALGLGGALGAISLLTGTALWLLVIGGVFVVEALSVMMQVASYKWCGKRRIFRVAPLHHHVHLGGLSEPKVVVRFWIVGAMLGIVGFIMLQAP